MNHELLTNYRLFNGLPQQPHNAPGPNNYGVCDEDTTFSVIVTQGNRSKTLTWDDIEAVPDDIILALGRELRERKTADQ